MWQVLFLCCKSSFFLSDVTVLLFVVKFTAVKFTVINFAVITKTAILFE